MQLCDRHRPRYFEKAERENGEAASTHIGAERSYWYGEGALRKQVLFDISIDIFPGEIVILTGPSGSGRPSAHIVRRIADSDSW